MARCKPVIAVSANEVRTEDNHPSCSWVTATQILLRVQARVEQCPASDLAEPNTAIKVDRAAADVAHHRHRRSAPKLISTAF